MSDDDKTQPNYPPSPPSDTLRLALALPVLRVGSRGAEVQKWQTLLRDKGMRDASNMLPIADGIFGPRTAQATDTLRKKLNLPPTGVVDAILREKLLATEAETQPESLVPNLRPTIIQSKYYKRGRVMKPLAIVLHTPECMEIATAAENVAAYLVNPPVVASCNIVVDCDSVVQCVAETDTAYHAGPVNDWTLGIEIAGKAGQTRAQWQDDYSLKTLDRAVGVVASWCNRYDIPAVRTPVSDIRNKGVGIYRHVDVSDAYGLKGNAYHWDPGPGFDLDGFIARVAAEVASRRA